MICSHCGIQPNEHEATRCLDAWVAEKVMGAYWTDRENVCRILWNADGVEMVIEEWLGKDWVPSTAPLPLYSTSIEAAGEVMEKIKDQSIDKQYKFVDILYGIMKHRGLPKGALMLLPLYIDPLAICRAVLKAVTDD